MSYNSVVLKIENKKNTMLNNCMKIKAEHVSLMKN